MFFVFCLCSVFYFFFFFKQKTAYEMRISDWSSDVCSSDLMAITRRSPFHSSQYTAAPESFGSRSPDRGRPSSRVRTFVEMIVSWWFTPIFSNSPSTRCTAWVTVRSCRDFQLLPPVATRLPNRPYCWSENRVRGQPSGHDSG